MDIGEGCCILCFEIIEFKKNSDPGHKYYDKNYKQTLFDCCNRLLGVQIESSNTKFSVNSCSPFCLTCFQLTEELWQIEEKTRKTDKKKELDNYVETFTDKILQCRLTALSNKLTSAENYIDDVDLEDPNPDLPFDQVDDKVESSNEGEIKLEIKEEVNFIEGISSGNEDHDSADWNDGVDDLSTSEISTVPKKSCRFEKSNSNKLTDIKSKSYLPELRVLLERLQFDTNGNVLQTMCPNKRVRNRNQVITSRTLLMVENSSLGKRCRRNKTDQTLRSRDNDDKDFECSERDETSDSEESEDDQLRNSRHKRKIHFRRSKRYSAKKTITRNSNDKNVKVFKCAVCPSGFSFARELDFHSKTSGHVNERPFKCTRCCKSYHRRRDLTFHTHSCNYQSRKCDYCDTVCQSFFKYYVHVRTHDEWKDQVHRNKKLKNKFQCAVCSSEFELTRKFQEHLKGTGHINVPTVQCTKCPRKFYNDLHLKNHERSSHELYLKNCRYCNKEISGRSKYWHHLTLCRKIAVESNAGNSYDCTQCKIPFTLRSDLLEHMKTHWTQESEKLHKCDKCDASFYRLDQLSRHNDDHLNKTNIQCQICFWFYKTQVAFEKHMKTHKTEDKKIECNLCEKKFKILQDLIAHQITDHAMQSPFLCKHCKTTFNYHIDLKRHLKFVHKEKPIRHDKPRSCDFCGKIYKGSKSLLLHLLSHTNFSVELIKKYILPTSVLNGSFQCEDCGKSFATIYTLSRHGKENNSEGSKEGGNFPCQECDQTFSFRCALNRHLRGAHSSTDYVECNICGNKVDSRKLTRHLREHKKRFVCDVCGEGFGRADNLKRHVRLTHEQITKPKKLVSKRNHEQSKKPKKLISKRTSNRKSKGLLPKLIFNSTIQEYEVKSTDVIESLSNQIIDDIEPSKVILDDDCLQSLPRPHSSANNTESTKISRKTNKVPCHICGSKIDPGWIKRHLIEHVKRFVCDNCGCRFGKRTDLKIHIERIHQKNKKPKIALWKNIDKSVKWNLFTRKSKLNQKCKVEVSNFIVKSTGKALTPKINDQSKEITINEKHLNNDPKSFKNIELHSDQILGNTFKATLDDNCWKSLQYSNTTTIEESYNENTFDDTYFEDTTADYGDHDDNADDLIDSSIPFEHPIKEEDPFENVTSKKVKSFNKSQDIFTETGFRELRVLLERLQFDSEGNVIKPACNTGGRLRKRKAAIFARTKTLLAMHNEAKSLSMDKKIYTSRSGEDLDFFEDLSVDSEEAEENEECRNRMIDCKYSLRRRKGGESKLKYRRNEPHKRKSVIRKKQIMSTKYKCTDCQLTFKAVKEFQGHLEASGHVSVPSFECQKCHKSYHRLYDLQVHEKVIHDLKSRICKICGEVCKGLSRFKCHLRSHRINSTEEKPSKCDKCKATFLSKNKLLSHQKHHLVKTNVQCNICYLFYKNKTSLRIHKYTKHKLHRADCGCVPHDKKQLTSSTHFKCTTCLLPFETEKVFHDHLEATGHVSVPSFGCQKCPKSYHRPQDLRIHEKVCHDLEPGANTNPIEEKPFKCDKCKAAFCCEDKLLFHKEDHLVGRVQCNICYLFYKNKSSLRIHKYTKHKLQWKQKKDEGNVERRKLHCDYCNQSFSEVSRFIAHQISEHGMQSPFTCKHCKNTFNCRKELKTHLKSVHKESSDLVLKGLEPCDFCGKYYKTRTLLLVHTLAHLNVSEDVLKKIHPEWERRRGNFQCEDCGKMFTLKDSLKLHWKRYHAPDAASRTITCNTCGRVLPDARSYKNHLVTHEKKFQCEICGRNFCRISTLQGHIKRIHEQNKTPRKSYTRTPFPKNRMTCDSERKF